MNMLKRISLVVVLVFAGIPSETYASATQLCTVSEGVSFDFSSASVATMITASCVGLFGFMVYRCRLDRKGHRAKRSAIKNAKMVHIHDPATGKTYSVPVDTKTRESDVIAFLVKNYNLNITSRDQAHLYTTHDVQESPIGEYYRIKAAMVDYLSDTFSLKIWKKA